MAWLQATPDRADKKTASVPRIQTLQSKKRLGLAQPLLVLPHVAAGEYLIGYLFEVGPLVAGDPISWREIAAWRDLTGVNLDSWEAKTLKAISEAYASEYYAATDPARPPPKLGGRGVL